MKQNENASNRRRDERRNALVPGESESGSERNKSGVESCEERVRKRLKNASKLGNRRTIKN